MCATLCNIWNSSQAAGTDVKTMNWHAKLYPVGSNKLPRVCVAFDVALLLLGSHEGHSTCVKLSKPWKTTVSMVVCAFQDQDCGLKDYDVC